MTNQELAAYVFDTVAGIAFGVSAATLDSTFKSLGLDALHILDLALTVERELQVPIDEKLFTPESRVKDLVSEVNKQLVNLRIRDLNLNIV